MESFTPKVQHNPAPKAQETIKQAAYKRSSLAVILLVRNTILFTPSHTIISFTRLLN